MTAPVAAGAARGGRPSRAVIVGAGLMGRWHADAVRRVARHVAAVVDADVARARALAARHAGARAAASLTELTAAGDLAVGDVVHVCTPVGTHAPLAEAALAAGCHALVEKPLAEGADAVGALLAQADAAGRLVVPVHQYLFQPGVERARRLLAALGPVLHVDAVACTAGADGRPDAERDRVALEILPHPLSLLARLVDVHVDTAAWAVVHPRSGELRVSGTLGVLGTLGAVSVGLLVSTRGRPTRNTVQLVCARGTIRLDLFHGFAVVVRGEPTRAFKVAHPFVDAAHTAAAAAANLAARAARREPAYPGLRELVRRMYAAAEHGLPAPIPPAETLAVVRALGRIGEAAGITPAVSARQIPHGSTRDVVAGGARR